MKDCLECTKKVNNINLNTIINDFSKEETVFDVIPDSPIYKLINFDNNVSRNNQNFLKTANSKSFYDQEDFYSKQEDSPTTTHFFPKNRRFSVKDSFFDHEFSENGENQIWLKEKINQKLYDPSTKIDLRQKIKEKAVYKKYKHKKKNQTQMPEDFNHFLFGCFNSHDDDERIEWENYYKPNSNPLIGLNKTILDKQDPTRKNTINYGGLNENELLIELIESNEVPLNEIFTLPRNDLKNKNPHINQIVFNSFFESQENENCYFDKNFINIQLYLKKFKWKLRMRQFFSGISM